MTEQTLEQAKQWLRDRVDDGARCPCCNQYAKIYRRKLNSGMAAALVRMYRTHGCDWQDKTITLRGYAAAARDESLLRYWDLLEEATDTRDDGGRAGWWRVTTRGAHFVQGFAKVQSHALVYDSNLRSLDGPMVTIHDCLGAKFSLAELMAERPATT